MPARPEPPPRADDAGTRFVLVGASHAGNVGAAARAIKVMGFADLVLVRPRRADLAGDAEARARASGATDVLERARCLDTLDAALDGIQHACATAMTPRDFGPPTHSPREHLPGLAATGRRVAFVFGSERVGLGNADVYRCHACLSIPTDARYGSLNLAQAVQLIAYEWRLALGGFAVRPRTPAPELADAAAVHGALEHWREVLVEIGYLDPDAPKKLMPRLQQLAHRAQLSPQEVHILRGIARALRQRARRG